MSTPKANLGAGLRRKAAQEPTEGGVAATFRKPETAGPTKKATYNLPADLHRTLHVHAASTGTPMRDLVVRYIEAGLRADGANQVQ